VDDGVVLYAWRDCLFRVPEGVQPPKAGSRFFCRHLSVRAGERVLEIGAGLGLAAVLAAKAGAAVVATDVVPGAVTAVRANAALNGVTFSAIFLIYTRGSIASTFLISGAMFGAISAYGAVTKRDSHFGEDRWISSTCEANLKTSPDWKALLAEVDSRSTVRTTAADASNEQSDENWGMTVENRVGASYGVSHIRTALTFGAPQPGRGPKLQDMVNALAATAKRAPVVAQH